MAAFVKNSIYLFLAIYGNNTRAALWTSRDKTELNGPIFSFQFHQSGFLLPLSDVDVQ